jgi:hypothetical protein
MTAQANASSGQMSVPAGVHVRRGRVDDEQLHRVFDGWDKRSASMLVVGSKEQIAEGTKALLRVGFERPLLAVPFWSLRLPFLKRKAARAPTSS